MRKLVLMCPPDDTLKRRVSIPAATKRRIMIEAAFRCGLDRCATPGGPLDIHHIDEDPSNNDEMNLLVLCAGHHAQVTRCDISRADCRQIRARLRDHRRTDIDERILVE